MPAQPNPGREARSPETELKYKCNRCGNMFAAEVETCDYCGFRCAPNLCVTLYATTEDY